MKKIYICAALGLFFASCSTEENTTTSMEDVKTVNVVTNANWIEVMNEIEEACGSKNSYRDVDNLIGSVVRTANSNPKFNAIAGSNYFVPTVDELNFVMNTDASAIIHGMNYSIGAKTYLKALLVYNEPWTTEPTNDSNLSYEEIHLLTTLRDIVDPDEEWDKKKPIAIAHGYQQSIAKAIIMAVLVQEFKKVNEN